MLFAIYKRSADLCGNIDLQLIGHCNFDSVEDASKEFPKMAFAGYVVELINIYSKEEIHERYNNVKVR